MKIYYLIIVFITLILLGCSNDNSDKVTDIDTYNISYKLADAEFNDLIDSYELIELDTCVEAAFNYPRKIISNSDLISILDDKSRVLNFNRDGSFISVFDRQGRGPDEYLSLGNIYYSPTSNEVIATGSGNIFNINRNSTNYSTSKTGLKFTHLSSAGDSILLIEQRMPRNSSELNYYLLTTDRKGKVLDRRIKLPLLEGPGLALYGQLHRTDIVEGCLYHFSLFCDTVYKIQNGKIMPDAIFKYDKDVVSITNGEDDINTNDKYHRLGYIETLEYRMLSFNFGTQAYTAIINKESDKIEVYSGSIDFAHRQADIILKIIYPEALERIISRFDPGFDKCLNPDVLQNVLLKPESSGYLIARIKLKL